MNESQKEFLSLLSYLFLQNGKYQQAQAFYLALQTLFPDDPLYSKSLSYTFLNTGEYESALSQAEQFLRQSSDVGERAAGYLLKSRALWKLDRKMEAREALNQFLNSRG